MVLNTATVMAAIQEYLDKRMIAPSPRVTVITWAGTSLSVVLESPANEAPGGFPPVVMT